MRPTEITDQQVIEAGQALQDSGRNVTGFALRQRIGGGNPSRLRLVWDAHVANTAVTQAEPIAELPVEVAQELGAVTQALTDRINGLARELNDRAVKAAERRVAELVRTTGEQRELADKEIAEAAQAVEELEDQINTLDEHNQGLIARLSESQAQTQAQALELVQLRERLAAEQQARNAEHKRVEQLLVETSTLSDKLAGAEQRSTQAEGRNTELVDELNRLRADLASAQAGHREQAAEVAKLAAEKAAAEERAIQEIERLKSSAADTEQRARTESERQASEIAELRNRLEKSAAHAERLQDDLKAEKRTAAEAAQRAGEKLIKLEAEISAAKKSEAGMREKVASLAGELNGMKTVVEKMGPPKPNSKS